METELNGIRRKSKNRSLRILRILLSIYAVLYILIGWDDFLSFNYWNIEYSSLKILFAIFLAVIMTVRHLNLLHYFVKICIDHKGPLIRPAMRSAASAYLRCGRKTHSPCLFQHHTSYLMQDVYHRHHLGSRR